MRYCFQALVVLVLCGFPAAAQQTLLGRTPSDRDLPGFFSQHLNASNLVVGLASANGQATLHSGILPVTLSGKTLADATFSGVGILPSGATLRLLSGADLRVGAIIVLSNSVTIMDQADDAGA